MALRSPPATSCRWSGRTAPASRRFLRLVAGLLEPDAGAVRFDPEPDGGRATAIHYLGHLDALKRTLTVGENLAFWRRLWGGDGSVADALDAVELDGLDDLPVATLSAGQRRRVALARLLVADRPLWLLDEPATSLDAGGEAMLGRLIAGHLAGGGIVIAATHRDLAGDADDDAGDRAGAMIGALAAIAGQTARLSLRSGGGAFIGLVFFLAVVAIMPFGIGPDMKLLSRIGPAILWIGALLATLLGLDRLFQDDRDDGSLDLLALSGVPLELVVLAKACGHWLATGLPLVIVAPFLGLLVGLEPLALATTTVTLLAGTPALTLIGAIGAALIASLGRGGVLVAVLVLPFTIPVLIFGVSAASAAIVGPQPFLPPFLILIALSLVSLVTAAVAGAAALRSGMT